MCHTTHYTSPTCGHSYLSLTTPCSPSSDLLSCPQRIPVAYLIAPPYSCPTCNAGFASPETLQMIHGPWGVNQMVRNYYGGEVAVGDAWMGPGGMGSGWMGGFGCRDSRVGGPYGGPFGGPAVAYGAPALTYGSSVPVVSERVVYGEPCGDVGYEECCEECCGGGRGGFYDGGFYYDGGYGYGGGSGSGRRYRSHDYKYKYRRSSGEGCCVM